MPIYMDAHFVPGVKAKNVAEAHRLDLVHQEEYQCKCMTYWVDEERGNVFCLLEAPDKDAVIEMHRKAHGLLPHKIIEVSNKVVQSFLGRIFDPEVTEITEDGLALINDASYRILLVTKPIDPVLLQHQMGKEEANDMLQRLYDSIRKNIPYYGGSEVECGGTQCIISFTSASSAVACALSIAEQMKAEEMEKSGLKIAVNAGIPVENTNTIFGDVIQQAVNLCSTAGPVVRLTSYVKDLVAKDNFKTNNDFLVLSPQDEKILRQLFTLLEENFQDQDFDIDKFSKDMATSTSGLYRKTMELTGLSPNQLLKEFRLARAKDLMQQRQLTIAQIAFETGFTSPSYFTKCFKAKYGLLPMQYIDMIA